MIAFKSKKMWVAVTGVVLLAPVILNMTIFQFTTPWTYGDGDEWLSFWGSYSGALISAVVAYIVANFQIKKQQLINEHERAVAQLPSLMRIRIVLNKYSGELRRVKQERDILMHGYKINNNDTVQAEGRGELEGDLRSYTIELFNEENYSLVEKIVNIDLLMKLTLCFDFYDDFSKAVSFDLNNNKEDSLDQIQTITKKQIAWRSFLEEDKLGFFQSVLGEVYEEIGAMQERIKNT
ncbi:hypothetical protein ACV242_004273 [Peribacillus simplex]